MFPGRPNRQAHDCPLAVRSYSAQRLGEVGSEVRADLTQIPWMPWKARTSLSSVRLPDRGDLCLRALPDKAGAHTAVAERAGPAIAFAGWLAMIEAVRTLLEGAVASSTRREPPEGSPEEVGPLGQRGSHRCNVARLPGRGQAAPPRRCVVSGRCPPIPPLAKARTWPWAVLGIRVPRQPSGDGQIVVDEHVALGGGDESKGLERASAGASGDPNYVHDRHALT